VAKFIIPFYDITNWKHNSKCATCTIIDNLISEITMLQSEYLSLTDNNFTSLKKQSQEIQDLFFKIQSKIDKLEHFQVDGYNILQNYESHGIVTNQEKIDSLYTIKNIKKEVDIRINNYLHNLPIKSIDNADKETTLTSRWCKQCSIRKCDIFDTNRTERMDLLSITNAFAIAKDYKVKLNWEDSKAKTYSYTQLFKNNKLLINATFNQYKSLFYIDRDIIPGKLYEYTIVNYDKFNEILTQKKLIALQERTEEENNNVIPDTITDTKVRQRIILKDNQPIHVLTTTFTTPDNAESNNIRLDVDSVPYYEFDGEEISKQEQLTNILINDIEQDKYEIKGIPFDFDKTYYIKPYPYSEIFYKKNNNQYIPYRMYNRNSAYDYIIYHKTAAPPTNLSIRNSDKKCFVRWEDTNDSNWKSTIIMIREYNEYPISNDTDGEISYVETERNLHIDNEYCIDNLISGKKYQIGIFSVSKEDIVTISPIQLIGEPLYLRNEADFNGLNVFDGYSKISYTKYGYFMNEHDSYWWKYLKYYPIYGAKMYFSLQTEKIVRIRIYINDTILFETTGPFWKEKNFIVDIPPAEKQYKICFWATLDNTGFAYSNFHLYLRKLKIIYNAFDSNLIKE